MGNKILDTKKPIKESDLQKLEERFKVVLPIKLREHYLRHNGGRPLRNLFKKGDEYFQIQEFLPIRYGKKGYRFEDTYQDLVLNTPEFPKHCIPFAIDPGGDYYCVSTMPNEQGAVYCHIHEYYDEPDRALVYLASSVEDFVNEMTTEE